MIIDTPCGKICGEDAADGSYHLFKGIRYAKAKRWKLPQQIKKWDNVYKADHFGNCCWQPRAFKQESTVPEKKFYYNEFRNNMEFTYSEDCLFLNIYVPHEAVAPENRKIKNEKFPVVFFVHGGGYIGGCAHEKPFSGEAFCHKGVILVTIQYRLNIFGFFSHPELQQEGPNGNFALYDQLTALQWVRDNISSFGGNAENITLMGQSAGAMSLTLLALSPLTEGMYSKAVLLSGGGILPDQMAPVTHKAAEGFYCTSSLFRRQIDKLRKEPPQRLSEEFDKLLYNSKTSVIEPKPVLDGELLPEPPSVLLKKRTKGIPTLIGSTMDDIAAPVLHDMARSWALAQTELDASSYCYLFSRNLPGDEQGSFHSSDLWYFFGSLNRCWRPFTPWDNVLSSEIMGYVVNFAYTGNPNKGPCATGEQAFWDAVIKEKDTVMRFGNSSIGMQRLC